MNMRRIEERVVKGLMIASASIVAGSLVFILATILIAGLPSLSVEMITKTPEGGYYLGKEGGILNAIVGSLVLGISATVVAAVGALPVALYLNVYLKKASRFALALRFFLDALSGIPSIVYGAIGFTVMVWMGMQASLLAGIFTVALLIFPIMVRAMDEVLKMIPPELKESSFALGTTRLETAVRVIARQASPLLLTAVMVSFGRGIGDAASVLFTAGFTDSMPHSLFGPVATLPLAIFFQLGTPFPEVQERGYASAVVLTAIVLSVSLASRYLMKASANKHSVTR